MEVLGELVEVPGKASSQRFADILGNEARGDSLSISGKSELEVGS